MKHLFLTVSLAATLSAAAYNQLPVDPDVRIGNLDNGLTYYIRHNERPANRADFFLAQSVGSINEEENQRGLAHFLEHLCFNGTVHFPGHALIDWLESVGVKFGADLNAYTSTDRTVYNICQVPSERTAVVDSCLLIMRDWSGNLLLNEKDIDEERGVIEGEWRQRNGQAASRLLEKAAPEIYPGSLYGVRMPIGLMSVVRNFKPDELRDYYRRWYHPRNQCVVVVGDIDPDYVESQIKALWADAVSAPESKKLEIATVPENERIIATVQTDPEQTQTLVQLYIKHSSTPDSLSNTIVELRNEVMSGIVAEMLAERFDEIEQSPDSPFSNVGIGDRSFLLASNTPALLLRAQAKNGNAEGTVATFASELKRAAVHGFTPTELSRAKLNARAEADSRYANASSVTNTTFAKRYVDHYLSGGILPSEQQRYKMIKGVINSTSLDDVNSYIADIVSPADRNVVLIVYAPEGTSTTRETLASSYASVDRTALTPYVDSFADAPLIATLPAPGSIVAEEYDPVFGVKTWTLSNGIRVRLKHNGYDADRVLISAKSPGGISQTYNADDISNYLALNDVLAISSVGENSSSDLRKLLAGKNVSSTLSVDKMTESISASSSVSDLETAFALIYLRATDLRPDTKAFDSYIANQILKIESRSSSPVHSMGDSIHSNVFDHHPLGGEHLHSNDIDRISYSRILDIWRDRFSDMSDFTFYVAGNFDEDSLRTYVEQYVATLPASGRLEQPRDIGYHYASGREHRRFTMPMETPQTIAYTFFNAPCDYTLENVICAHIFGTILKNRLHDDLRESRGWTYGIKGHAGISAGMNGDDPARIIMPIYIRVAPENADATFNIVTSTAEALTVSGSITAEELNKVREHMAKNYADNMNDNSYWLTVMYMNDRFGRDMHSDYIDILNSLTPDSISSFAKSWLTDANRLQLEMSPEQD